MSGALQVQLVAQRAPACRNVSADHFAVRPHLVRRHSVESRA